MYLELQRNLQDEAQTLGNLLVMNEKHLAYAVFSTLELAWRENQRQISCIPAGVYTVRKRWSWRYGNHLHLIDVQSRSMILIHAGNFFFQTKGCILIGHGLRDINGDGKFDVINSRKALDKLLLYIKTSEITLNIIDVKDFEIWQ